MIWRKIVLRFGELPFPAALVGAIVRFGVLSDKRLEAVLAQTQRGPIVRQKQAKQENDVSVFLRAIEGDEYELPLFVALFTGLRQGELLGLTWDCVDFEKGTLLINKQHHRAKGEQEYHFSPLKNSRPRSLTAATAVMDALREQRRRQEAWADTAGCAWDNYENLVFTTQLGRYINNKTLWMNFKRIVSSLGMPELRFHDLRHTFSINSLQAGDDIKTVQENLGHATAAFTLSTYAHATMGMKRESANRMDAFIRSVREGAMTTSA